MPLSSLRFLRLATALALIPLTVSCQLPISPAPFVAGAQRSNVEFSFSSTELSDDFGGSADIDSLNLAVSQGYFVTPNFELGGELAFFSEDYSDNFGFTGDSDGLALGAYGRYYFVTDTSTRPFAEIALGIGSVDSGASNGDVTIFGLSVGVLQMLSEFTAMEFALRMTSLDIDISGFTLEEDTLGLFVGYSIFL